MLRLSRLFSSSAAKKIEEADLLRSHEFKHLRFTHNPANQKKDLDLLYMKRNLHFLNKRFSEETFKEMLAVQAKLGYTTPANHGVFHRMFEVAVTNSAAFTKYTYPLQMLLMVESKRIPVEKQQLDSMAERLVDLTDCRGNRETLRTFGAVFELIANGFPKLLPRLFAKSLKTLRECLPGMSIESLVPISAGLLTSKYLDSGMLTASKEYLRMVERHTEYMDYKEYWRLMSVLSKFLQGSFQNDAVVDQMVQINYKIADRIAARPVLEDHFNPFDVANIYQSLASKDWNLLVEKHRGVKSMLERFKTTKGLAYQRFLSDNPSRRPNRGLEFASSKESLEGIPSDLSSCCSLILRRDLLSTVERVHSVNMVFQLVDFKYRELHVETGLTKNEVDVLLLHLSRNLQIEPELVSYFDNGQVSFDKLKDRLQGFVFTDPLRKEMNLYKTLLSCKQN